MANLFSENTEEMQDALDEAFSHAPNVGDYDAGEYDTSLDDFEYASPGQNDPADNHQEDEQEVQQEPGLESRFQDLDARLRNHELEQARQRNQELARQLEEAQSKLRPQEPEAPKFDPMRFAEGTELTEEEAKAYEQSRGVIDKMVRAAAASILAEYDRERVARLEQNFGRVSQIEQTQQQLQQQYETNQLQAVVAQVNAQNTWLASELNRPEYHEFLNQRQPGSLYTRGQTINAAAREGKVDVINEILSGYARNPANMQQAQRPVGASVSPGRANAVPQQRQTTRQTQVYQYTKYKSAFDKFNRGEITLDEFTQEENRYFAALAEGRVAM